MIPTHTRANRSRFEWTEVEDIAGTVDPVAGADDKQPPVWNPDCGSPRTLKGVAHECGTVIPALQQQIRALQGEHAAIICDDLHRNADARFLHLLAMVDPMHPVPRSVLLAALVGARQVPSDFRHQISLASQPHRGGALAGTGWCRPLRHPSHPRAWGWRTVKSELGDGVS